MKPRNLYRILIGILLIISGIVALAATGGENTLPVLLIAAGFAFLVTGIIRNKRYGDEPESDERSKKIGAYGLSYAWLTGTVGIMLLFWADYAGVLRLNGRSALEISLLLLVLSAIIFQAYLFRKGDVD